MTQVQSIAVDVMPLALRDGCGTILESRKDVIGVFGCSSAFGHTASCRALRAMFFAGHQPKHVRSLYALLKGFSDMRRDAPQDPTASPSLATPARVRGDARGFNDGADAPALATGQAGQGFAPTGFLSRVGPHSASPSLSPITPARGGGA